jgi:hypothetical protein
VKPLTRVAFVLVIASCPCCASVLGLDGDVVPAADGGGSAVASDGSVIANVDGLLDSGADAGASTVDADSTKPDSADATTDGGVDAACTPVTHDNGLGQQWTDCVPLGTYNLAQALKACAAYCAVNSCLPDAGGACINNPGEGAECGNAEFVTAQFGDTVWQYAGSYAGYARPSTSATCPGPPLPTWN